MKIKQTTKYFDNDNRLNKGFSSENTRQANSAYYQKKLENILPPLDLLEAYEDLSPGFVDKMLKLAEQEQENNKIIELAKIEVKAKSSRLGNVMSFFAISLICALLIPLSAINPVAGIIIGALSLSLVAISLFWNKKTMFKSSATSNQELKSSNDHFHHKSRSSNKQRSYNNKSLQKTATRKKIK